MKPDKLKELERRVQQIAAQQDPAPFVVLTLRDGTKTPSMLWVDAAQIVLSGEAVAVESADADTEALLNAML